ncbi:metal-dependent hydrolase [Haloarcula litorea]|uniref:metal-dependent hydrolase n=1 Tax=Haloarcula litorea TaxID=3032579 RepID=UPI0023E814EF|nr:metal-dependent hydrolase [Halomicroarcula sp. GDY20]
MWPWGHAAVGYLVYSLGVRAAGRTPRDRPVLALAVGTQFPDLVDKPLGWTLGVLPGGRSLAHSLLTLAVVGVVLAALVRRLGGRDVAVSFVVGAVSHTLADGVSAVVAGEYGLLTYLLWPVLAMPEYSTEPSFAAHLATLGLDGAMAAELALVGLAVVSWQLDGRPGLGALRAVGDRWRYWRSSAE